MSMAIVRTGDGRVHLAAATYAHKATPLTAAQAEELGAAYDLLVTQPNQLQGLDADVRQAGARSIRYTKSNQSKAATYPSSWYSHKTDGSIRKDSNWGVYCMEPSNTSWVQHHIADLITVCKDPDVDGVFSDSSGSFTFTQGGNNAGKPPDWKTAYGLTEWLKLMKANLDQFAVSTATKSFILNGLAPDTVDLYTPTTGLIEAAYGSKSGRLPDLKHWQQQSQFILYAQSRGWTPWVWIKLFGADYATEADRWRRFMGCTALLLDQGSIVYDLSPAEGGDPAWVTKEYQQKIYNPHIGLPIVDGITSLSGLASSSWPGLYTRSYDVGLVVVNPTPSPITITLSEQQFVVPAQDGAVIAEIQTVEYEQVV